MKPIIERLKRNEFAGVTRTKGTFWYHIISIFRFLPDNILNKLFGNKIVLILYSEDRVYKLKGKEFYDDKTKENIMDLNKLEEDINKLLESETDESLRTWIDNKRKSENMNSFTPEQLMQIFGLYPNAQIKTKEGIYSISMLELDNKEIVHGNNDEVAYLSYIPVQECQLILTDTSEITNEHLIEIAKINGFSEKNLNVLAGERIIQQGRFSCITADFLREHNYHTFYKGKNLYDEGVAIKPNK